MNVDNTEFIWAEKYRPKTVEDCILPSHTKKLANNIVKNKNFQNLLFYGSAGCGKTTTARAICDQLQIDSILINGSKEGRLIETVRTTVTDFASTMSVFDGYGTSFKVVIYDEFDNAGEVQMAIRGLMDEVSSSCRFIFTGNYITKIIEPLQSRTSLIDFSIPQNEMPTIMSSIMSRCEDILKNEGVAYNKKVLAQFVMKYAPDFRKILNELQSYSTVGKIDGGIFEVSLNKYDDLIGLIQKKDFKGCEMWMRGNTYDGGIYSMVEKGLRGKLSGSKKAGLILMSNMYQIQHLSAIDTDLNLRAYVLEVMDII